MVIDRFPFDPTLLVSSEQHILVLLSIKNDNLERATTFIRPHCLKMPLKRTLINFTQMTSVSIEFCAFTAAIALECRPNSTQNKQWCVESLSEELKTMEHSKHHNFYVDPLALHQGLSIFKKPIERLGNQIVPMSASRNQLKTEAFMDLAAKARGSDIIFSFPDTRLPRTVDEMVADILKTANILLQRMFNITSKYVSISEICGSLWIENIREISFPRKRRKRGEDLGERQLERYGREVRDFISTNICVGDESPFLYINEAVKQSVSKSVENLDAVRKSIFECITNDEEVAINQILAHPSVADHLLEFPKQYIRFTSYEKQKVVSLFDIIKSVRAEIEGENYSLNEDLNAIITKKALSKRAHYSELVTSSVVRWSNNRNSVKKETGKKINIEFEADVWGKLMICEFEKINVSYI